jgi:hypothetical protein
MDVESAFKALQDFHPATAYILFFIVILLASAATTAVVCAFDSVLRAAGRREDGEAMGSIRGRTGARGFMVPEDRALYRELMRKQVYAKARAEEMEGRGL